MVHTVIRNLVFLTVLVSFLCVGAQNIDFQCPADPLIIDNGEITFPLLSEGSGAVDATYNASFVSQTWYSLANGFVNAVQRENLPYDLIISVVNSTFLQPSSPDASSTGPESFDPISPGGSSSGIQSFDPLSFLERFASWWAGILAVTLLGIVLGLLFCVCGCCYWCCRCCCGNCGGAKYQRHRKNNDCLTFTFAVILFLVSLLVLVGAVLSFFSNEQVFQNLANLQSTLNNVVGDTVNYASDTLRELIELFCQLTSDTGVVNAIIDEAVGVQEELVAAVGEISTQLQGNGVGSQLNITILQDIRNLTGSIASYGGVLENTTELLGDSLLSISGNLATLSVSCGLAGISASQLCAEVITPVSSVVTSAFDGIPNVTEVGSFVDNLSGIVGSIDGQNQTELMDAISPDFLDQLNSTFNQIQTTIEAIDGIVDSILNEEVRELIDRVLQTDFATDQCPPLDGFQAFSSVVIPNFTPLNGTISTTSSPTSVPTNPPGVFDLSIGYIRECIINASFDYIRMFDNYRYAFGIVVCSLSLVIIGLIWIGIVCGFAGFRRGRLPSERSSLSNCGGNFLLLAVGVAFLFGFFLLLLSGIFFFFGANMLNICQALQGPTYELFAQTIDRPEVRTGIEASVGGGNGSIFPISEIPSISGLFRQCEEDNTALFTALNLGSLLQLPNGSIAEAIGSAFNLTQLQSTVGSTIDNLVVTINPENLTAFIEDGIRRLESINITDLNATGLAADLGIAVANADINGSIENLRNLSSRLSDLGEDDVVQEINDLIVEFENIRDNVIPVVLNAANQFAGQVQELANAIVTLTPLVTQIAQELANISQPFVDNLLDNTIRSTVSRSFSYLEQYIEHLENEIESSVGGCQPLTGIYTQFHNVICRDFIDGLNGFWWSLGLCAVLYIPLVIFATLTASFFKKKMTNDEEQLDAYHDYQMKAF